MAFPSNGRSHFRNAHEMGMTIHRKIREVQFAAGGRQIAQTFPLIDARFVGTPIKWERTLNGNAHSSLNAGGATCPPGGGKLHRRFHSSERPLIGTLNRWERHCIR